MESRRGLQRGYAGRCEPASGSRSEAPGAQGFRVRPNRPILAKMANMQVEPIRRVFGRLLLAAPSLGADETATARAFIARGLEVLVATTAEEALRQAEQTRFDLVICDLALPHGGGLDLLRALREREIDGPAFLLCGGERPLLEAARLGAFCLEKPVEVGALLDTALRRLRRHSGSRRGAAGRSASAEITTAVAATAAKNQFGQLLGAAMQGGRVVITKRDAPSAVLLSYADYRELTNEDSPDLEALRHEFDDLLERMQAPAARDASDALFGASPTDLADAARADAARPAARPAARAEARGDGPPSERG